MKKKDIKTIARIAENIAEINTTITKHPLDMSNDAVIEVFRNLLSTAQLVRVSTLINEILHVDTVESNENIAETRCVICNCNPCECGFTKTTINNDDTETTAESTEVVEEIKQVEESTEEPEVVEAVEPVVEDLSVFKKTLADKDLYQKYEDVELKQLSVQKKGTGSHWTDKMKNVFNMLPKDTSLGDVYDAILKETGRELTIPNYVKATGRKSYNLTVEDLQKFNITEKDGWIYKDGEILTHFMNTSFMKCVNIMGSVFLVKNIVLVLNTHKNLMKNTNVSHKNGNPIDTRYDNLEVNASGNEKSHLSDAEIVHIAIVLKRLKFDVLRTACALLSVDRKTYCINTINKVMTGGYGAITDKIFSQSDVRKLKTSQNMTRILVSPDTSIFCRHVTFEETIYSLCVKSQKNELTDGEKENVITNYMLKIDTEHLTLNELVKRLKQEIIDAGFPTCQFPLSIISRYITTHSV